MSLLTLTANTLACIAMLLLPVCAPCQCEGFSLFGSTCQVAQVADASEAGASEVSEIHASRCGCCKVLADAQRSQAPDAPGCPCSDYDEVQELSYTSPSAVALVTQSVVGAEQARVPELFWADRVLLTKPASNPSISFLATAPPHIDVLLRTRLLI